MEFRNRMKRHLRIAVVAGVFGACVLGQARAQTVSIQFDPVQSKILWTLADVLHTVSGTFALSSGSIAFSSQSGAATGLFTVSEDTGQSGNSTRDGRMKKSVLKTGEYPLATFKPMHVTGNYKPGGTSQLAVDGFFRIYGADHPMRLNFQVNTAGKTVTATTKFDIPYVAWGMHDPSTLFLRVGKDVQVQVDARGTVLSAK